MRPANLELTSAEVWSIDAEVLILPTVADRVEESKFNREIYNRAGREVLEVYSNALPLRPGNVSVTSSGNLSFDSIVHVPVQSAPGVPTTLENLRVGLRSGLVTADEEEVRSVVLARIIPNAKMDEMNPTSVARTIFEDLEQYPPVHFQRFVVSVPVPQLLRSFSEVFP